jgi:hypothetical protein
MNENPHIRAGCSEEFAELCALATTGALSAEEMTALDKHVTVCAACRELLADYDAVANTGMSRIAAERDKVDVADSSPSTAPFEDWNCGEAKQQLLDRLQARETSAPAHRLVPDQLAPVSPMRRNTLAALAAAAILILGLSAGYELAGYRTIRKSTAPQVQSGESSVEQQLLALKVERDQLHAALAANTKTLDQQSNRVKKQEDELALLRAERNSLEAKAQQTSAASKEQAEAFASERETVERRLAEAEQSLKNVTQKLDTMQEERRQTQLRTASLESTIDELSGKLREREETVKRDEEFLVSDRDVRELMGARQLYIADVFDVDQNGSKRKPYGRVFYTKGKSLIFYAFDLDQAPAYRNASETASKSFQVWGSEGQDNAKPVGLGVFYMDSESNRRWVFKADDPAVLAHVNAVFVTVESKDGDKKRSSKPFLYAYLRTAPINHP